MLENIRIASPCPAEWAQMRGDGRVRHCELCNLNVYNFSAMTEREIRELVEKREGRICARLYRRRDGTAITRNCPVGVKAVARISRIAGAVFSFLAATFGPAPRAFPQTYTLTNVGGAEIWVEVRDPAGALVREAEVTLLEPSRNQQIHGITDKHGRVMLWGAVGGRYDIKVSALGFQTYTNLVELRAGEVLSAPVVLDVGAVMGVVVIQGPRSIPSRNAIAPGPIESMGGSPGMLR